VDAGHCSCNGLEGQWNPSKTTADALRMRLPKDNEYYSSFREHTKEALEGYRAMLETLQ